MMMLIDGKYTTDMNYWVVFASERLENVIKSIPVVKGLELTGSLSEADCESINKKGDSLEFLDLSHAKLPGNVTPKGFLRNASRLSYLRMPGDSCNHCENRLQYGN